LKKRALRVVLRELVAVLVGMRRGRAVDDLHRIEIGHGLEQGIGILAVGGQGEEQSKRSGR